MNLNNEETPTANAAAEKILGDIICIAEGAIGDCAGEDEAARTPLYAAALGRIRDLVRRDWLDMGDFRLTRFHAGDVTTFIGTRKDRKGKATLLIEGQVANFDGTRNLFSINANGAFEMTGNINGGRHKAERALVGALHGLCAYRAANRGGKVQSEE